MSRTIHTRSEFLQSSTAQGFADSITAPAFVVGLRAALLEFLVAEPHGRAWEDAARSHHYSQGAKDFAEYLLTFTDSEPVKPKSANQNLEWPTKQSLQQRRPPKAANT